MIGRTIAHYRIEAELGRGGMGVVYRAYDERLRRKVALKLLSTDVASHAERRARVLAEARAAAALNHPGVTTIYEVVEEGEHILIAMELVEGQTLRHLLRAGPLEPRALARLGTQAAEALAAAHAHGVMHGDVKPENIILLPEGRVKLLDFGIARQVAEQALTLTRSIPAADLPADSPGGGTLAYMAPEQLRGEPADARSDLFSLGGVLYELAAGHRAFPGPTASAMMAQILHEAPVPLATAAPGAPMELVRVVNKLLEKSPASRYQSAREVQADLQNLVREIELGSTLPAATPGKCAVAVLPFKLLSPNPEDEYLSVALADTVNQHLSMSGELLVRPTSTVMKYAGEGADPLLVARELGVQVVIGGSIQKSGARLRVHIQAWNAPDGTPFLSAKHDGEMGSLFELQDEIAAELRAMFEFQGRIRARLDRLAGVLAGGATVATPVPPGPPTNNPRAYELYLRAVERFARLNRWDTRTAIEMLESATRLDPGFARAWGLMAEMRVQMALHFDTNSKWVRQAEANIRRALALDPRSAEAHCARGKVLWTSFKSFQNRAALRALEKARHVNPGYAEALRYRCIILFHVGLVDEAREGLAHVLESNPDDAWNLLSSGHAALYAGAFDEAEEYYSRALTLNPAGVFVTLLYPLIPLYTDRLDEAEKRIKAAQALVPGDDLLRSYEALLWARRGETRRAAHSARAALRKLSTLLHGHHTLHYVAAAFAALGKKADAVRLLHRACKTGLPNYSVFRDDPHFRPLHGYRPYEQLMAKLKREWEGYRREFGGA